MEENSLILTQETPKELAEYKGNLMDLVDVEYEDQINIPNDQIKSQIWTGLDVGDYSPETVRKYKTAIQKAIKADVTLCNPSQIRQYFEAAKPQEKIFFRSAIHIWLGRQTSDIRAKSNVYNSQVIDSIITRLVVIKEIVDQKVTKPKGDTVHTWLNRKEADKLMTACIGETIPCKRDRAVLALMLGLGLRRFECSKATFDDIVRQGDRYVLKVIGKGNKKRRVPISLKVLSILNEWREIVGGGNIARGVLLNEFITEGLAPPNVFKLVRRYGKKIGIPTLAPHDLRRSYSQFGRDGGITIRQMAKLLGHASELTTETYLAEDVDLNNTASDYVPMGEK